jgi:DNA-binding transcriptional LysR family regulator
MQPLFGDTLVPVARPDKAAELTGAGLADLAAERLIHLDAEDQRWTRWTAWFRALGHGGEVGSGPVVNNYMIALQAAEDAAGLVLGWERLIAPLLASGRLAVIPPHRLPAPSRFELRRREDVADPAACDALERFLLNDA